MDAATIDRVGSDGAYVSPITALLFSGNILGYLDRAAFAIAAPLLAADLHLSPAQVGWLLSAFSIGYIVVSFTGGAAADRFGAGPVIAIAAVAWSVACAMTALPAGFAMLMAIRIAFGAGEGPYTPVTNKVIAATVPASRYSGALALVSAGQPLGGLAAGPVIGAIALRHGWRAAFVAVGAAGLAWALLWSLAYRRQRAAVFHADRGGATARPGMLTELVACLRDPGLSAIALAYFGFGFVLYFFLSWFPSYLVSSQHLSVRDMSLMTAIPWTFGLAGLIGGGFVVNRMQRRDWGGVQGRKHLAAGGLTVAAACVMLCGAGAGAGTAVALMSIAAFAIYLTGVCYPGLLRELVDPSRLGAVSGFIVAGFSMSGVVAPVATGMIVGRTGSYAPAFLLVGAVALLGALVLELAVKRRPAAAHGR